MSVLVRREQRSEGGHLAHLTIDNIGKLNSLNRELMIEIVNAVAALDDDPQLRLAILSGAGERAFVGGADVGEIAALDHVTARSFITLVHRCCAAFRRLPVPVIARIDGYALGAGLELACACDLRVASERAIFGMPEVRVGIPSVVEAALLPKLIGPGRARRLLLTGETIDEYIRPEIWMSGAHNTEQTRASNRLGVPPGTPVAKRSLLKRATPSRRTCLVIVWLTAIESSRPVVVLQPQTGANTA